MSVDANGAKVCLRVNGSTTEEWTAGYAVELPRPDGGGRSTHWFDQIFVAPDSVNNPAQKARSLAESENAVTNYYAPRGSSFWAGPATIKVANDNGELVRKVDAMHVLVVAKTGRAPSFTANEIWIWTGDMEQSREINDLITTAEEYAANE